MPQNQRRRRRRRARWRIDNPARFMTSMLILLLLLVVAGTQINRCGKKEAPEQAAEETQSSDSGEASETGGREEAVSSEPESQESSVEPVVPESSEEPESEPEPEPEPEPSYSGRKIRLDSLDRQIMGFLSGIVLSNESNHAKEPEEDTVPEKTQYLHHIIIDPTHGGEDTGVQANGIVESEFNLAIAQRLQMKIRELDPEIEVSLTREDNTFVEIADRIKMANERGADLYIGIQCTAYEEDPEVAGVAVMFWDSDEKTDRGKESLRVAMVLVDAVAKALERPNAGAQLDLSEVLYQTEMPAVSIRLGFITNDYDAAALTDDRLQSNMIQAAAEQIVKIVNTYEPHVDVQIPEIRTLQPESSESSETPTPADSPAEEPEYSEDPGYYEDPENSEDPGYYEDPENYEDPGYSEDPEYYEEPEYSEEPEPDGD